MTDPEPEPDGGIPPDKLTKVVNWLRVFVGPGDVAELRALKMQDGRNGTVAGTFLGTDAELEAMAREALRVSGWCQGVYLTLNPLRPDRHRPQAPRLRRAGPGELAKDRDVLRRRWVLVDIDPVRAPGREHDGATDDEKGRAWDLTVRVRAYLAADGWPAPAVADSGNGYHLLYRLPDDDLGEADLPLPDGDPVRLALRHLAEAFDGPDGVVDTTVFNPGRIVKFPGTLACKGADAPERPHRRARLLEVPDGQAEPARPAAAGDACVLDVPPGEPGAAEGGGGVPGDGILPGGPAAPAGGDALGPGAGPGVDAPPGGEGEAVEELGR